MSFSFDSPQKDVEAARFIGEVQRDLARQLIIEKRKNPELSQAGIARTLGIDKASITRIFSGNSNITLRKLAEIAWAMGLRPHVGYERIAKKHDHRNSSPGGFSKVAGVNYFAFSPPQTETSRGLLPNRSAGGVVK